MANISFQNLHINAWTSLEPLVLQNAVIQYETIVDDFKSAKYVLRC